MTQEQIKTEILDMMTDLSSETNSAAAQDQFADTFAILIISNVGEGGGSVSSVNGKTGIVVLNKTDIGLGSVPNLDTTSAVANQHTHSNNAILDEITEAFTSLLKTTYDGHLANTSNPHGVTKAQVGLGSADNTSDADKPVSTAAQTALNAKADLVGGKVPSAQMPSIAITEFLGDVASQVAMLALSGELGDWCIRTDEQYGYVIVASDPTQLSSWRKIVTPASPVSSVNGQVGVIVLATSDIADTTNKRYVTDSHLTVIGNTSGTNSGDETTTTLGSKINGATEKTTPVDADRVGLMDSAASNVLRKLSWANIKATLKNYFDTLYQAAGSYVPTTRTITINGTAQDLSDDRSWTVSATDSEGWTVIVKSANQDVTNNATLQDDTEFQFSVVAGGHYMVDLMIATGASGSANDYKFAFALSSGLMTGQGSAIHRNASNAQSNTVVNALNVAVTNSIPVGQNGGNILTTAGVVVATANIAFYCSANATFKFQFANNTAGIGGISRTWKGSVLRYKRID